jgi:hypothetical protein
LINEFTRWPLPCNLRSRHTSFRLNLLCWLKTFARIVSIHSVVKMESYSSSYMIYLNQWLTISEGILIADTKEKVTLMKRPIVKAFFDCILVSLPLLLDLHLLRMNLAILTTLFILIYILRYVVKCKVEFIDANPFT